MGVDDSGVMCVKYEGDDEMGSLGVDPAFDKGGESLNEGGVDLLVVSVRTQAQEAIGDFCWRIYQTRHASLRLHAGGMEVRCRQRLHRFAGHLARQTTGLACGAWSTSSLAWASLASIWCASARPAQRVLVSART